jgi:hypothetical protein
MSQLTLAEMICANDLEGLMERFNIMHVKFRSQEMGDVYHFIKSNLMEPDFKLTTVGQIIWGLLHMDDNKFIHRDVRVAFLHFAAAGEKGAPLSWYLCGYTKEMKFKRTPRNQNPLQWFIGMSKYAKIAHENQTDFC